MPKEHSGGVCCGETRFRVPVVWVEDQRSAVRTEDFDFEGVCARVDSLEDQVREALRTGGVELLLRRMVRERMESEWALLVGGILCDIKDAKDAGLAAVQICFATGIMDAMEVSGTDYAAQFGVSKQDFQQGIVRYARKYGLRQTRNMRDSAARKRMSLGNYRPGEAR